MHNGITAAGLSELAHDIQQNPAQGISTYGVQVRWLSGTRSKARALPMKVGDPSVNRDLSWVIDEPKLLGGSNHAPNPQEYPLSGFGSCLMVACLVGATIMGLQLSPLEIEVRSEIDLAGFLSARDGTPEQFEQLRQADQAHSPNAMSLVTAVPVSGRLELS